MEYESCITYHSKAMANVKVFADKQKDKRTGQKLYAPDLLMHGHKNSSGFALHSRVKEVFFLSLPVIMYELCVSLSRSSVTKEISPVTGSMAK